MTRIGLAVGVLAAAIVILGVACGDDEESAGPVPVADPGIVDADFSVDVQLSEWEVIPETQTISAGSIRFFARNNGDVAHELAICRDSCEAGEVAELAEVQNIVPGSRRSFAVELEPGQYELACLIIVTDDRGVVTDHRALGMFAKFTVE